MMPWEPTSTASCPSFLYLRFVGPSVNAITSVSSDYPDRTLGGDMVILGLIKTNLHPQLLGRVGLHHRNSSFPLVQLGKKQGGAVSAVECRTECKSLTLLPGPARRRASHPGMRGVTVTRLGLSPRYSRGLPSWGKIRARC